MAKSLLRLKFKNDKTSVDNKGIGTALKPIMWLNGKNNSRINSKRRFGFKK